MFLVELLAALAAVAALLLAFNALSRKGRPTSSQPRIGDQAQRWLDQQSGP